MKETTELRKLDDLSLIREYEGCKVQALNELHRRYFELTESTIRQTARNSLSREEVEEINQIVWIRVLRIKDSIQPPDRNVAGWLARIAKHRTIDELRRRGRFSSKHISYDDETDQLGNPSSQHDDPISALQYKDLMQKILTNLKPKERIVFFLIYGLGYKQKEVAFFLDAPINSVSSWAKRARATIERFLKNL